MSESIFDPVDENTYIATKAALGPWTSESHQHCRHRLDDLPRRRPDRAWLRDLVVCLAANQRRPHGIAELPDSSGCDRQNSFGGVVLSGR